MIRIKLAETIYLSSKFSVQLFFDGSDLKAVFTRRTLSYLGSMCFQSAGEEKITYFDRASKVIWF